MKKQKNWQLQIPASVSWLSSAPSGSSMISTTFKISGYRRAACGQPGRSLFFWRCFQLRLTFLRFLRFSKIKSCPWCRWSMPFVMLQPCLCINALRSKAKSWSTAEGTLFVILLTTMSRTATILNEYQAARSQVAGFHFQPEVATNIYVVTFLFSY